ncbi:MAG TPA: HesA/MoeB/ThiF family protein [Ignavibacteria bacterium]|nr:HesA/MoeB/ThiF family protein [Ignavibacteria bacterium]
MNTSDKYKKYEKQILLREFGEAGQKKLNKAKVLIIGAGGLGCPALQYLAAAGVGNIGIADFDVIEISNLHRQILFTVNDIGKSKAETAASKLKELNPDIRIDRYNFRITNKNALEIIAKYDLVIDGSDNFNTRYMINDVCVLLGKPLIYGAVSGFEGQAGVFNLSDEINNFKTNYRDLFPNPPETASEFSCNESGVLGILPGMIGIMQATEAIKIITGIGIPLKNRIISFNALSNSYHEFQITTNVKSKESMPQSESEFFNFNYDWFCNKDQSNSEINAEEFDMLRAKEDITIIDVREKNELPEVNEFSYRQFSLSELENSQVNFSKDKKIVLFCNTGSRSLKAIKILKDKISDAEAYSLKGGIEAWKRNHKNNSDE